jgi:hypothetical protein
MVDAQDSGIDLTGQVAIVAGGGRGVGGPSPRAWRLRVRLWPSSPARKIR